MGRAGPKAAPETLSRLLDFPAPVLTERAVERASFALQSTNVRTALIGTGLAGFPIDQMTNFILALRPIGGEIVPDAGSSAVNRLAQNRLHDAVQALHGAGCQAAGDGIRMNTGAEQDFVRVDVPDTGDGLLMHQQRLEPAAAAKKPCEFLPRHTERIAPEAPGRIPAKPVAVQQRETAEPARVPIAHRRP